MIVNPSGYGCRAELAVRSRVVGERLLRQGKRVPIQVILRPWAHEPLRRKDGGDEALGVRRSLVEQRTPRFGRQAQAKPITKRREEEPRSLKTQHSRELVYT